jgi:hypothetical protein
MTRATAVSICPAGAFATRVSSICPSTSRLVTEELAKLLGSLPFSPGIRRIIGGYYDDWEKFEEVLRMTKELIAASGLAHVYAGWRHDVPGESTLHEGLPEIVKAFYLRDRTPGAIYRGITPEGLQAALYLPSRLSIYDKKRTLLLLDLKDREDEISRELKRPEKKDLLALFTGGHTSKAAACKRELVQIEAERREVMRLDGKDCTQLILLLKDWYAWMGIEKLVEWKR